MNKGGKVFLIVLASIGILAGVAGLTYGLSSKVHNWVDQKVEPSKDNVTVSFNYDAAGFTKAADTDKMDKMIVSIAVRQNGVITNDVPVFISGNYTALGDKTVTPTDVAFVPVAGDKLQVVEDKDKLNKSCYYNGGKIKFSMTLPYANWGGYMTLTASLLPNYDKVGEGDVKLVKNVSVTSAASAASSAAALIPFAPLAYSIAD
jgi:hypothetical protein